MNRSDQNSLLMTRDEIYDHLAKVYLGKRENVGKNKKRELNAWLVLNIVIMSVIFASAFYALSAFLAHRDDLIQNKIIYALNNTPIRLRYNFADAYPSVETFSIYVPQINVNKFKKLNFSIRGVEYGSPGILKVVLKNRRQEAAAFYINNVGDQWQDLSIPLKLFEDITDWTELTDVSFVLEAWNVKDKKGIVLIENVCFSS